MQNYKDLKVWEKAHQMTLQIYKLTVGFPKEEMFGITSQIRRSSASIPSNIAEGCGKNSQKDFINFLHIALGSANETEYFLILSKGLNYLTMEIYNPIVLLINEVKAMLISLIKKIKENL